MKPKPDPSIPIARSSLKDIQSFRYSVRPFELDLSSFRDNPSTFTTCITGASELRKQISRHILHSDAILHFVRQITIGLNHSWMEVEGSIWYMYIMPYVMKSPDCPEA